MAYMTNDIWYMTYDMWYMTYDIQHTTYDMSHMICHIWYVTYDRWRIRYEIWYMIHAIWQTHMVWSAMIRYVYIHVSMICIYMYLWSIHTCIYDLYINVSMIYIYIYMYLWCVMMRCDVIWYDICVYTYSIHC